MVPMDKKLIVSFALVAACFGSTPLTANAEQSEKNWGGPRDCRVSPPAEWKGRTLSWEGACREGKAYGEGVLRGYKKGGNTLIFFGAIENGELSLGVIEEPNGYIAGKFNEGKLISDSDRDTIVAAFRKASAAARTFSEKLKVNGNKQSSEFYLKKADELDQQMD